MSVLKKIVSLQHFAKLNLSWIRGKIKHPMIGLLIHIMFFAKIITPMSLHGNLMYR